MVVIYICGMLRCIDNGEQTRQLEKYQTQTLSDHYSLFRSPDITILVIAALL